MRKNFIATDDGGKLVLKSVKLTQPLVKPEIKEAVIPAEINVSEPAKKNIIIKLIEKLKKLKDELF
ncbi:hypothetical protein [Chryseobacterium sp. JUb7]|uniref:hypothetical protein n=1 Tax=Chryseobacterium sp. JUb7 TaxID=2940599 RepID=UPI002168DB80|nr:hypothetical protein [Chryseobacterium sp. JUb7]MCS3528668.1 hypothetical protein [Chryseobacterium sp. JUb7]